ncbi:c-type cytochrome [Lutibacter sp.]|uniref:c-type cytochrome n=1 Tax=Lutibacter sp. TaxID=1925666 RepID=UPI0027332AFA|nr:c-type cytochrome [Lutibacter sp.]MDP3312164.1 hypothetical protein [Lutibacter sp.]
MKKLLALSCFFSLFIFASCSSNSDDDDIIPPNNPPASNITYTNTISSIMSENCTSCHGATPTNNAPMSLNTYATVKSAIENRGLINQIETGNMPKNGNKLTTTQIQNIKTWQANGFPQ